MFTIDQIKTAHAQVKSGADFPKYVQDIIALGVSRYTTWVNDGHTDFEGANNYSISSPSRSELLNIAFKPDANSFRQYLQDHQSGKTDYISFCRQCAQCGVEKWVVDISAMTCSYFDKANNTVLVEAIPS